MKYSSAESSALIDALSNNIEVANEITERLSSGCAYLVSSLESGKLQRVKDFLPILLSLQLRKSRKQWMTFRSS